MTWQNVRIRFGSLPMHYRSRPDSARSLRAVWRWITSLEKVVRFARSPSELFLIFQRRAANSLMHIQAPSPNKLPPHPKFSTSSLNANSNTYLKSPVSNCPPIIRLYSANYTSSLQRGVRWHVWSEMRCRVIDRKTNMNQLLDEELPLGLWTRRVHAVRYSNVDNSDYE